ncbi:DUF4184 family protein [Hydromonas duriensis]|uniref:DUF4184 family protein n=1 Tax=Hydromonas duriensis TaxID=1527608 RepID=UPI0010617640
MPFTLSHPAAALLFKTVFRVIPFGFSALIIGSMILDASYFVHSLPPNETGASNNRGGKAG